MWAVCSYASAGEAIILRNSKKAPWVRPRAFWNRLPTFGTTGAFWYNAPEQVRGGCEPMGMNKDDVMRTFLAGGTDRLRRTHPHRQEGQHVRGRL